MIMLASTYTCQAYCVWPSQIVGCISCIRCRQLLPIRAVSVCQSVCHAAHLGFTVWGSFSAAFAKSFWPLVKFTYDIPNSSLFRSNFDAILNNYSNTPVLRAWSYEWPSASVCTVHKPVAHTQLSFVAMPSLYIKEQKWSNNVRHKENTGWNTETVHIGQQCTHATNMTASRESYKQKHTWRNLKQSNLQKVNCSKINRAQRSDKEHMENNVSWTA